MEQRGASSRTTPTSSSSSRNPGTCCPICLDPIRQEAYLDRCFHTFCYKCITNWMKHVTEKHEQPITSIRCPMCKSENASIIHGLHGNFFQRFYVNRELGSSFLTGAHQFRWRCYGFDPDVLHYKFGVLLYWKNSRYLRQNQFLQAWLKRELQTLLQEEDVDIIMHHILGVVDSFFKGQQQERLKIPPEERRRVFKQLLSDVSRPFISERTERFVDELELFLASSLNIEAYDRVYMEHLDMLSFTPLDNYGEDELSQARGDIRLAPPEEDLDKGC